MREESSAKVAELTGRKVIAMMSANHIDPDLGAEIYVLDGPALHASESGQEEEGDRRASNIDAG